MIPAIGLGTHNVCASPSTYFISDFVVSSEFANVIGVTCSLFADLLGVVHFVCD